MSYNSIGDQLEAIANKFGWESKWVESTSTGYEAIMGFKRKNGPGIEDDVLVSYWNYETSHTVGGSRWYPADAVIVTENNGKQRTYAKAHGFEMTAVHNGEESIHMWQYIFGFIAYHLSIDNAEDFCADLAERQGEVEDL